ncbi:helix-turn-helix domain-containing protein [Paenibacillus odorifer]|uniref:helix-turn-helix domain-containing protein n=1 Tax=Paenibacillus TaxID=44249 RepID=UPI00096BF49A
MSQNLQKLRSFGIVKIEVNYTIADVRVKQLIQVRDEPARPSSITGEVEARIIALACSEPPKGYARWKIRLLTSRVIELNTWILSRNG